MTEYQIELPYPEHSGNQATRHSRGQHYTTDATQMYRAQVLQTALRLGLHERALSGPLEVDWLVAPPDTRARDEDNLRKPVQDAVTKARIWADDSNRVIRRSTFTWTDPVPGGAILLTIKAP